ncbi:MAG: serine hydroxymethyltransferase, partial [Microgenomates group bacterium]
MTHGHPRITFSGKYFKSVQYQMAEGFEGDRSGDYFDFDAIRKLALKSKPKILVVGTTAFPRILDWKKFAEIADEVGAYLLADISHIAGLVAGGVHPSPVPYAQLVTTTTHKTLRGPRGAIIMVTQKGIEKDPDLPQKIDKAVFPGLQGGPHLHTIAGIAIALEKARQPEFKVYANQTVKNAKVLAEELTAGGFDLVTGGTDNHLMVVDLRKVETEGKAAAVELEKSG